MGRYFACSDLHGMYELYEQICRFLNPDDRVIFLGDAADRGTQGWKLIKAIKENPQWTSLMGNHELMLLEAMDEEINDFYGEAVYLLYSNGGYQTLEDWRTEGAEHKWISYLARLPLIEQYTNKNGQSIFLTHAGFTPGIDGEHFLPVNEEHFVWGEDRDKLIWDRDHIYDKWACGDAIIIHGHTPIPSLCRRIPVVPKDGALWYCDGHKCCIDNGAFATGKTCLLDLDTFEEFVFEIPDFVYTY